ncbi:hypothetical protein KY347_03610 [Candidatus Woesearchaeota archaeon]|nr:hypothetical protein [Candidatus Woesearchaeota archaeon]
MLNWLKRFFGKTKERGRGFCPKCGGKLAKARPDVIEAYGKPVMVCSKCKKLVEL